jgi:hypothetical protein
MRKYLIDDQYIRNYFDNIINEIDNLVPLLVLNEFNESALELSRALDHIVNSQRNFEKDIRS